jgi:hypothetical protein
MGCVQDGVSEGGGFDLRKAASHFVLFGLFVYSSLGTRFRDNNQPTRHNSWCGTAEHVYKSTISIAGHQCRHILCRARTSVLADLRSPNRQTHIVSS